MSFISGGPPRDDAAGDGTIHIRGDERSIDEIRSVRPEPFAGHQEAA